MGLSQKLKQMESSIPQTELERWRKIIQKSGRILARAEKIKRPEQSAIEWINEQIEILSKCLGKYRDIRSYDFQIETLDELFQRKLEVYQLAREMNCGNEQEKLENVGYTQDFEQNRRNLIRVVEELLRQRGKKSLSEIINMELSSDEVYRINRRLTETLLDYGDRIVRPERNSMYENALVEIITFLEKTGRLTEYADIQNFRMNEVGIPEMQVEYNQGNSKKGVFTLKDLNNPEALKRLDINQKRAMMAYYSNRAAKEIEELMTMLYLLGKTKNNISSALELNDETLRKIILEYKYLTMIWKRKSKENIKRDGKKSPNMDEKDSRECIFDNGINKDEFEAYFGENSLEEDRTFLSGKIILLRNVYDIKTSVIEMLIYQIMRNGKRFHIDNWGYILQRNPEGKNSVEARKDFILIGIDFPGLNMPIRLHMERKDVLELVTIISGNSIIPVYNGDDDFRISIGGKRKRIGTQLLMPVTYAQKKSLEQTMAGIDESNSYYKFISHLNWIANRGNKARHLIQIPQRYIDLTTGEITEEVCEECAKG